MQKAVRVNDNQICYLANKAKHENTMSGYLYKKSADTGKWQLRWFALYQNMLFYYENAGGKASGLCMLEGSFCERLVTTSTTKPKDLMDKQHTFAIYYRNEGQRQYDLRAESEHECLAWMEVIRQASYSKVLEQKEQLEQKHLHLLQILDSERQAKWHYVQQTEEFTMEVKKLKNEVTQLKAKLLREFKRDRKLSNDKIEAENEELRKIKKVQSFFRGWLCRRRWKMIVEEYIHSDHAESMRKRNSIVFGMVECEEEYVKQLSTLVSVFLRPFRMAASSKKPPISHDDVNSIFLNSETLLFLHQIFLKGLMARMENWPTLVLGDLFDMLLPMLGIYQEYVRNHHYSLQVLAEYKQKSEFNDLLRRYEEKSICEGRTLETFLTYPMHQVPRYIITIHELLAHTPHDHVERKSLEFAQGKLEDLSQIMQDEVSETENIRKNLAIERMIVEGCDILLDVNQTFVRQGSLLQVFQDNKRSRTRLGSFGTTFKDSKKDSVRQVFLFTNHMLLTTRASNGRLHLAKHNGKISLIDCTLIEDFNSDCFFFDDETASVDSSVSTLSQTLSTQSCEKAEKQQADLYNGLDFRIIVDSKSGPPVNVTLVASSLQEKAAWCSDISQCIENLHYSDLVNTSMTDISSVTMPQSVSAGRVVVHQCSSKATTNGFHPQQNNTAINNKQQPNGHVITTTTSTVTTVMTKATTPVTMVTTTSSGYKSYQQQFSQQRHESPKCSRSSADKNELLASMIKRSDPKLFRDDIDIKFSRTLNSCKVPQIRHATVDRLLDRLTDLRFLSIDFLNTFLLTYRVFTTGETVLNALKRVYKNPEYGNLEASTTSLNINSTVQEPLHRHSFDTELLTQCSSSPPRPEFSSNPPNNAHLIKPQPDKVRRTSTGCMKIEVTGEKNPLPLEPRRSGFQKYEKDIGGIKKPSPLSLTTAATTTSTNTVTFHNTATTVNHLTGDVNINIEVYNSIPTTAATSTTLTTSSSTATAPNKPTLAPIASCETLSEFDCPAGDEVCDSPEDLTPSEEELEEDSVSGGGGISDSGESDDYTTTAAITINTHNTGLTVEAKSFHTQHLPAPCVTFAHIPGSSSDDFDDMCRQIGHQALTVPNTISSGVSSETLTSANGSYHLGSAASSDTLVPGSPCFSPIVSPLGSPKRVPSPLKFVTGFRSKKIITAPPIKIPTSNQLDALALSPATSPKFKRPILPIRRATSPQCTVTPPGGNVASPALTRTKSPSPVHTHSPVDSPKLKRVPSPISYSYSSPNIITNLRSKTGKRGSAESDMTVSTYSSNTPRSSFAAGEGSPPSAKAGTVVTSSRASKRRSSSAAAATAFAVATAGSANPKDHPKGINRYPSAGTGTSGGDCLKPGNSHHNLNKKRESVISTAATMRVLNVMRHWVSKHSQDFEGSPELRENVKDMLEEMVCNTQLCPAEHKAAATILRVLTKEEQVQQSKVNLEKLLEPPTTPTKENFDTLSALDIAEQLTYLDHQIFKAIRSEELLSQAWMKNNKSVRAPQVLLVSKRFNEVSRLVVSEIVSRTKEQDRVACIEKWAAIADICRCMHNYNGVLQICAAFVNSSVYRLKKTWEKISKQTKQMIEKLQTLVSSESRFKNMRDALHRCDPPCIPYLGMYLTDLSFIEEGTPALTEEGLVNFSKMRMVAHVIREIQHFQQTSYRIEHHKRVTNYLLDPSRLYADDFTYKTSLEIEPRLPRVSMAGQSNC